MTAVTAAEAFDGALLLFCLFFVAVMAAVGFWALCGSDGPTGGPRRPHTPPTSRSAADQMRDGLIRDAKEGQRIQVAAQARDRGLLKTEGELLALGTGGPSIAELMLEGMMRDVKEGRGQVHLPDSVVPVAPGKVAAQVWAGPEEACRVPIPAVMARPGETAQVDLAALAGACGPGQTSIVNTLATVSDDGPQVDPDEVRQLVQRAAEQHGWKRCAHCDEVIPETELVEDTAGPRPIWLHGTCAEAFAARFAAPSPTPASVHPPLGYSMRPLASLAPFTPLAPLTPLTPLGSGFQSKRNETNLALLFGAAVLAAIDCMGKKR